MKQYTIVNVSVDESSIHGLFKPVEGQPQTPLRFGALRIIDTQHYSNAYGREQLEYMLNEIKSSFDAGDHVYDVGCEKLVKDVSGHETTVDEVLFLFVGPNETERLRTQVESVEIGAHQSLTEKGRSNSYNDKDGFYRVHAKAIAGTAVNAEDLIRQIVSDLYK